jgi:hypothetical protein
MAKRLRLMMSSPIRFMRWSSFSWSTRMVADTLGLPASDAAAPFSAGLAWAGLDAAGGVGAGLGAGCGAGAGFGAAAGCGVGTGCGAGSGLGSAFGSGTGAGSGFGAGADAAGAADGKDAAGASAGAGPPERSRVRAALIISTRIAHSWPKISSMASKDRPALRA